MKRIVLQPAYLLHRRAYRETSVLMELFTRDYGRFSVIANGVRKLKSTTQGILQPFVSLLVTCSGSGELLRLNQVEVGESIFRLEGECLYAGLYLNELLSYLLEKWDAHPGLYDVYANTIANLSGKALEHQVLRRFEKSLLQEIGYGLFPAEGFNVALCYRFIPEHGFKICHEDSSAVNVFLGAHLLAMMENRWEDEVLLSAKRLMRLVISPLLNGRSLYSRKLFYTGEG